MAVLSLFIAIALLFVIARVGAAAFELTGVPSESARFQSLSALTGVGFTTAESELIVRHAGRRRIAVFLMFTGSAGILGVGSSLVLSFVRLNDPSQWLLIMAWVAGGFLLICALDRSHRLSAIISRWTQAVLRRWTRLGAADYSGLLYSTNNYAFAEFPVGPGERRSTSTISDLGIASEDVVVLGICRADGTFLASPTEDTRVLEKDKVLAFGDGCRLTEIGRRLSGAMEASSRGPETS